MSDTASNSLDVLDITTACQMVVEDCLTGKIELTAVPNNLKAIGITPEAAQDYIKQIIQQIGEKKRGNLATWRSIEKQPPRASMQKNFGITYLK